MCNIISLLIVHIRYYPNQKGEFGFNANTNYYGSAAKMGLSGGQG